MEQQIKSSNIHLNPNQILNLCKLLRCWNYQNIINAIKKSSKVSVDINDIDFEIEIYLDDHQCFILTVENEYQINKIKQIVINCTHRVDYY